MPDRIFLLSPANCGGERGRLLLSSAARFDLARRLREPAGAPLGEVYSFVSGLYFRGKLAYARRFARPPAALGGPAAGALVITPGVGLRPADTPITLAALRACARVAVDPANARYRRPLLADARALASLLDGDCEVVLLGSIASTRYVEPLYEVFGARLRFPLAFVGRGDMSRGGLMLRCVREDRELEYVPVGEVARRGPRPPRLPPPAPSPA